MNPPWESLASILVGYSADVRRGDKVLIRGPVMAAELHLAVYELCLKRGADPHVQVLLPEMEGLYYSFADEGILRAPQAFDMWWAENVDVLIQFLVSGEPNRSPADTVATAARGWGVVREIQRRRRADGTFRSTICALPRNALTDNELMEAFPKGFLLNEEDPLSAWRNVAYEGRRLAQKLRSISKIRILEGGRTDLSMSVAGRDWLVGDGHRNLPDGECFTSPIEDLTEGSIFLPGSHSYESQVISDIELVFQKGRVVEASASENSHFLRSLIEIDDGACRLGEFGIGTNPEIDELTGNPLLDEKMAGTVHIALGAGFPEAGGTNSSALHFDLVLDLRAQGQLLIDGEAMETG